MPKLYTVKTDNNQHFIGTLTEIAKQLNVTKQAVSKAYKEGKPCKNHTIEFYVNIPPKARLTQKEKLKETLSVLRRAKHIIEDINEENVDCYSYISILKDIDKCLNYYSKN